MHRTKAFSVASATEPLAPFSLDRRAPLPGDVQIEILFCGVCHSDIHTVRNEWHNTIYPCVPGHEIVGRVTAVGSDVNAFKEGDLAAVGCMVDSCRTCPNCQRGLEQLCDNTFTLTYNSPDKHSGGITYGGYSKSTFIKPLRKVGITVVGRSIYHDRPRGVVSAGPEEPAPLRRHHLLLALAPMGRQSRAESRHRRTRRPRSHGS